MRALEKTAGWLSFGAAATHAIAFPGHAAEWWGYGLFFSAAAVAQVVLGLVLITQGIEGWGGWQAVRGKVYAGGIIGNLAILVLWALTRTLGVPAGPGRGQIEPVGGLDAASVALEVAIILCLARLFWKTKPAD